MNPVLQVAVGFLPVARIQGMVFLLAVGCFFEVATLAFAPRQVNLPSYTSQPGSDASDIGACEVQAETVDIGLRAYDGTATIKLACESGSLASPMRIAKNGTNYGVLLVATNAPNASRIRIPSPSGIKAVQRLP